MHFIFPINGDCVNSRDGLVQDGTLLLPVRISAPAGHDIRICGKEAMYENGAYRADVPIPGYRNTLTAEDITDGTSCRIAVYYMPAAEGCFRISSDDNILFLQDITAHQDTYRSIFENPYLAVYKKAHDLFGAKVHLNLFYEFVPTDRFRDPTREYFNLSMMTDRFRDEFAANSDWLKLAFHARAEFPDKPYKYASAAQITEDCIAVCREIIRFAGPNSLSDSTTVHWGEANHDCVRALRALGLRSLTGYFERNRTGDPLVAYYTDGELLDHIGERDFWVDTAEDMIFGRIDLVLNKKTYDWVMNELRAVADHPHRSGFVSVMIHEQYFYDDYRGYLPDFEARVLDACRFLSERGYRGAHITEVTAEPHHRNIAAFR